MLTDMITEEEFEVKEEEPWYDQRDLERDLHLAAELGKTLLERNHELEEGLQQMYSTNQEQQQEIEYLSKQVDLLRQVNETHAKVYEQLDGAARELELDHKRLVQDKRTAQQRIQRLTETIEGLQSHVEDLQRQVEELQVVSPDPQSRVQAEQRCTLGAQSVCCLKELYHSRRDRCASRDCACEGDAWSSMDTSQVEEENGALRCSVHTLQKQLGAEWARREEAEREAELTAQEIAELEQRLAELEVSHGPGRVRELEAELEELRRMWRSESASSRKVDAQPPDSVFFHGDEGAGHEEAEEGTEAELEAGPEWSGRGLKGLLKSPSADEIRRGHELTCIRRARAAKQRGMSLLNEVDAQYSALQARYEELLRRCQQGADRQNHKAVQTPVAQAYARQHRHSASTSPAHPHCPGEEDAQQPEYRALFQEIFTCIQKTREDLSQAQ
ncbi:cerebellar degeneration-related protein 2-like [Megalops cyprinoides]|uniref:cerebellar degeneration-related protein 2-like n=1 Tax=Megalops cyprinoides TaxID=118141 RepID=UPI001864B7D0|nr:cerebellar degeneration-related protein 2-like [Megalops cyprinoides]